MTHTDAELIKLALEIKRDIALAEQELKDELKADRTDLKALENELHRRLTERNAQNTKTDEGTAYFSTIINFKVVDRDAYLQFCLSNWDKGGSAMLAIDAIKDGVEEFASSGELPPGLEQSQFIRLNIRRS